MLDLGVDEKAGLPPPDLPFRSGEYRSRGPTEGGKGGQGERWIEAISCRNSAVIWEEVIE